MTSAGPSRFGRYDLLALLATGGMAEIWLARVSGEAGFEKLVVIKRLLDDLAVNPDYVEMFLDEARINARLSHSNVVQVLELGQVEGKYFMAMEYVAGLSVAQVGKKATQRLGDVPQAVAAGVVAQACAGLHYAHDRALPDGTPLNIIHRDVSPQNLILTFEGQVKVVDFGIAKAQGRVSQTRAGMVKGKTSYMSPEQCLGLPLDRRSDVFALGIVLFELATARRLFKRSSSYQTFEAIVSAEVPKPSELNTKIDAAVEAVILKSLARKADDRFASAGEMQEALEQAMHRAKLRGAPSDLEKFIDATFADERVEQQALVAMAQKGELTSTRLTKVSAVAEGAAAEARDAYARDPNAPEPPVDEERTSVDLLPPLGDDSGRTAISDIAAQKKDDDDNEPGAKTVIRPDFTGAPTTVDPPRPTPQSIPPLYYGLAIFGLLLIAAALVWLIAD
jgi:serine/threonine protein kinase